MSPARRPEGTITRGTTAPNRLRRVDRWIAHVHGPLLRRHERPLVVDLGYGASPVTTAELFTRLRAVHPRVEVAGIEIDPERVAAARPYEREGLSFRLGGFELPVTRPPVLVRAFNVLRQYEEAEAWAAWDRLCAGLAPGGVLVEGTCDEIGRRAVWVTLRAPSRVRVPEPRRGPDAAGTGGREVESQRGTGGRGPDAGGTGRREVESRRGADGRGPDAGGMGGREVESRRGADGRGPDAGGTGGREVESRRGADGRGPDAGGTGGRGVESRRGAGGRVGLSREHAGPGGPPEARGRTASAVPGAAEPYAITFAAHLATLPRPSALAERLPKTLIHRNVPGEQVHEVLEAFDRAWAMAAPRSVFGPRQRWIAAVSLLARDHPVFTGAPLGGRRRWRLGEVTLPWSAVAPLTRD